MPVSENPRSENKLLAALSAKCYKRLSPSIELIDLPLGKILYPQKQRVKHVYFPRWAAVSMVNTFEDGSMVEVGVVGREGVLGSFLLSGDDISPHQAIVQIGDGGWKMPVDVFKREIERNGELSNLTRRYSQALFTQVAQTAACNRIHPISQRLARWLLLMQDRVQSQNLHLTHEFIATMLGSRRAGVTLAAGKLQAEGIIRYSRGKVSIIEQEKLEEASCECHRIVHDEYNRLLGRYAPPRES